MQVIGKDRPIHDSLGKVTGATTYAGDMVLPRMAYVALVHSTIAHGYVRKIDTSLAEAVEGVYGVFHCFNTSERKFNRYRAQFSQELPEEERAFNNYVRFYGERVAAIAAKNMETARKAAKLISVEYEQLPAALTIDDALSGKNCVKDQNAVWDHFSSEVGTPTIEKDLIEVETHTELSRLHHAAMEPHVCVADYTPAEQMLTLYSPNQAVFGIRTTVANYLQMPYHRVRVVKTTMGGSFGGKQEWHTEPVAALLAVMLKRPVKLVLDRAEAMTCTVVRTPMRADLKTRFTKDGILRSLDVDLISDAGAYIGNSGDYVRALYGKFFRCYRIPYVHYNARVISSNTPVSGAYRGWSAPEAVTMLEHNINTAAVTLGIDPVELRLKNVHLPGETDAKTGFDLENIRIKEALELGREKFDWEKLKEEDRAFNASSKRYRRGIGVGCGGHVNSYFPRYPDFATVGLRVNDDGTIQSLLTLHDHGCGTVTMIKMILAETLGLPEEDILVREGDTTYTPYDYGCFSSRTTFILGRAVQEAGEKLKDNAIEAACELYGFAKENLYFDGAVLHSHTDPALAIDYKSLSQQTILQLRRDLRAEVSYHNTTSPAVTAAHFAHVEVDTYTGFTKILSYLAVQDVGQPINPALCIAQTQGAVQMGIGAALREKMIVQSDGHCTDSLAKYHLFLATDLPDIQVELLTDGASSEGPFGAKSIGEICYVPVAAAVCGAVNNALGSTIGSLPLDPDLILKHLSEVKSK